MKNTNKRKAIQRIAGIIALVAIIGITVAACGGGSDPKAIAKEGFALMQEMKKLMDAGKFNEESDPAVAAYAKKTNALNEKVSKLSPEAKKIMEDELKKLMEKENAKK